MKRFAQVVLVLFAVPLFAQTNRAAPPQLAFKIVDDFFQIPDTIWMAEAVGVALNSKGNIFILNRGNHPLLEFTPAGTFVRSIGEGSPIFHAAHSVRFDAQDNMWVVDSGNDVIVKVTPKGRIEQALGRRREPWVWDTHGIERAIPAPPSFFRPSRRGAGLPPQRGCRVGDPGLKTGPYRHLSVAVTPKSLQLAGGYRSSCPTSFALSAPGFGRNFCTRPLKTSAR